MKNWTKDSLELAGYKIENAQITSVDLSMADHGVLCLSMQLDGKGWGCIYGGYAIGKGYLGAKEFEGSAAGNEYLMRIMDIVGCEKFSNMKGKYIRTATRGCGDLVKIIGNIIEDKWFDPDSFFEDKGAS